MVGGEELRSEVVPLISPVGSVDETGSHPAGVLLGVLLALLHIQHKYMADLICSCLFPCLVVGLISILNLGSHILLHPLGLCQLHLRWWL